MVPFKFQSPSPSPAREVDEPESFDLFTPDTLEATESDRTPTSNRKRPSVASSAKISSKRPCNAASRNQQNQSNPQAQPKPRAKPRAKPPPSIVFGVDLGTTYSGISWAHSGNARLGAKVLTVWDETNTDYVKIPSAIKFDPPNDVWGINTKNDPDAVRWFKLLLVNPPDLDEEVRTSDQVQKARNDLQALHMPPIEAISTYLKHMFKHAQEKLKLSLGAATVDSSRFHVVFTVPAIWPEYARRSMQAAIKRAGILEKRRIGQTTHDFISEPEAAALATLSDLDGLHDIKAGDTLVVADCGGGTADIITYKVKKPNPMTVQEAVAGEGALCGEIFVAEHFKELVVQKLEEKVEGAMQHVTPREMQEIMNGNWEEEIRNQFSGAGKTWTIRLPYSLTDVSRPDPNRGYPTITITSEEVAEVFKPSVEKIESLVKSQVEAAEKKYGNSPKFLILVGGFGSSLYLREYLSQRFPRLQILQSRGADPWSAVSRGACIHGMVKKRMNIPLKVAVSSRISRESYGVVGEEPWDDEKHHHLDDKKLDIILQEDVSIKVMKWHVKQGDEVPINHKLSIQLTKFLDELPEKIVVVIYKSLTDQPSQRLDESVMKATEITWENIQIDWDLLEPMESKQGKTFKKLKYAVEMECGVGATVCSIYHRGYKQAANNVSLKFH